MAPKTTFTPIHLTIPPLSPRWWDATNSIDPHYWESDDNYRGEPSPIEPLPLHLSGHPLYQSTTPEPLDVLSITIDTVKPDPATLRMLREQQRSSYRKQHPPNTAPCLYCGRPVEQYSGIRPYCNARHRELYNLKEAWT